MKLPALLLVTAGLLAGCSTLDTHIEPNVDLKDLKHVYVERNLNENHGMDAMIVRALRERGMDASSGPLTLMPGAATVYFTYQDQWDWDFKDYLIALNITIRDANTDRILASVSYFRPTAIVKTPFEMVNLALAALLNQKSPPQDKKANPPTHRAPGAPPVPST
jgi:hypothetical protein